MTTRRMVLAGALLAGAVGKVAAQPAPSLLGSGESIRLWPGPPPGGGGPKTPLQSAEQGHDPLHPDRWLTSVAEPVLIFHRAPNPDGSAVLLVPGGGYGFLAYDNEGTKPAAWFNARGVHAYILMYRLPSEGWGAGADAPLQDAQRAVRLIRSRAAHDGVDAKRLAVLGFSAGGHLAGSLSTHFDAPVYPHIDAADGLSARPDLAGLIYPVITMDKPFVHAGSRDMLLGKNASAARAAAYSIESAISASTPPTFLVHNGDDGLVPVQNSLAAYQALLAAKRTAELHCFAEGGHGFGFRADPALPVSHWPDLFFNFGRRQGLFKVA